MSIFIENKKILYTSIVLTGLITVFIGVETIIGGELLSRKYEVVLKEDGFHPKEMIIKKGNLIVFSTENPEPFWPASNVHPTHGVYRKFDPKKPIHSDKTWSFQFDKVGQWRFHDHESPLHEGIIIVLDTDVDSEHLSVVNKDCENSDTAQNKRHCWEGLIKNAYEDGGLGQGFAKFDELYRAHTVFAEDCHGYTHLLGEEAYENYRNNEEFEVTQQVAYCSYGFFHGFMEAILFDTGDYEGIRAFCDYVNEQLSDSIWTLGACLHGIGHGVTDASDPRSNGDVEAIIEPGLELCRQIGEDEFEIKLCGTGVFNALSELYLQPEYNLPIDRNDPFAICRKQQETYFRHACYDDLKSFILPLENYNLTAAAQHIAAITDEDEYAIDAMDNLATFYVYYILDSGFEETIKECQALDPLLREPCISGLGAGFMTAGIPDKEYEKALELCSSRLLKRTERDGCYGRVLGVSFGRYPREKHGYVCSLVPAEYHNGWCGV